MKTFEFPEVKVEIKGKVLNPGDEGWHGMTKKEQEELKKSLEIDEV